jgi:hypothetical protein
VHLDSSASAISFTVFCHTDTLAAYNTDSMRLESYHHVDRLGHGRIACCAALLMLQKALRQTVFDHPAQQPTACKTRLPIETDLTKACARHPGRWRYGAAETGLGTTGSELYRVQSGHRHECHELQNPSRAVVPAKFLLWILEASVSTRSPPRPSDSSDGHMLNIVAGPSQHKRSRDDWAFVSMAVARATGGQGCS